MLRPELGGGALAKTRKGVEKLIQKSWGQVEEARD